MNKRQILEELGRAKSVQEDESRTRVQEMCSRLGDLLHPQLSDHFFESVSFSVSLLSVSPPSSDPCGDFISFLCFQPSSSSSFNSDTVTFLPLRLLALLPCLYLARSPLLFLPFFSRFRRSFPCAYNAAPNLNPIFHITSRKSYSAAGQEAVRRTALGTKERRNIFIFSLLLSSSLSLLPTPPCRPK